MSVSNIFCLAFMGKMLGWKGSFLGAYVGLLQKCLLINCLMGQLLRSKYGQELWWQFLFVTLSGMVALLIFAVYYQAFQGSLLKIGLVAMFAELHFVPIFLFLLVLLNYIEGREDLFAYGRVFSWLDLLMIPFVYGIWKMERRILQRYGNAMRRKEPTHRKILWVFLGGYILNGALSNAVDLLKNGQKNLFFYIPFLVLFFFTGYLLFVWKTYRIKVYTKRSFLQTEQTLIQEHYRMSRKQIFAMEKDQEIIKRQMKAICLQEEACSQEEKLKEYLMVLREKYEEIQAGIYCSDWIIDAVLCHVKRVCDTYQIVCEISAWQYEKGRFASEELSGMLVLMFDLFVKEKIKNGEGLGTWLSIKIGSVADQLCIEVCYNWKISKRKLKQILIPYVTRNDGTILWKKEGYGVMFRMGEERK